MSGDLDGTNQLVLTDAAAWQQLPSVCQDTGLGLLGAPKTLNPKPYTQHPKA